MIELFDNIFTFINIFLGAEGVFLICFSLLLACFIIVLILALRKNNYLLKKRLWFFFVVYSVVELEKGLETLCLFSNGFSTLTLALGLLFCIPVFYVKKGKEKTQKARDLVKFIDEQIHNNVLEYTPTSFQENDLKKPIRVENFAQQPQKEEQINTGQFIEKRKETKSNPCDLDFTHVKNVIARLEYLSLGNSDRRQIRELESVVAQAEAGDYTPNTKEKINDGLGALLKIMSKYGV